MRRIFTCLLFGLLFLVFQSSSARAQDILVPAGTLLHCTLDEPNLSSATADVGDPILCHLSTLREFGQNVFPRGSYLGGHLEASKEPGHFVGKGYLQLVFDRIGFPSTDVPVPSKVIAAKGYKVDRHGDIVGKGHATRDVVEWLIPPLWPWKIITLPAKGPRPTLKGEEQITVRLMDDIQVPRLVASVQSYERPIASDRPRPSYRPQSDRPAAAVRQRPVEQAQVPVSTPEIAANNPPAPTYIAQDAPPQENLTDVSQSTPAQIQPSGANFASNRQALRIKWIALKSGNVDAVTNYCIHNGSVSYVLSTGVKGSVDSTEVDWRKTSQLNSNPAASAVTIRAGL